MLEKIVKKFKKPINITLGDPYLPHTHIVGRYVHFESSFVFQMHKKNNGSIQLIQNRNSPWAGFYFEYGVRKSEMIQIIPFYFCRNNSSISFGLGLHKAYFGFRYTAVSSPAFLKNRIIYYYGNLW